ncbi:unnamed protein product [Kluyveromyces dobzhanskii CBS 2104]|uniref:WGS project CCBQ000000000 data, contig 00015 n=1 Tax=Kluyveromyces dobzhanskii CBS 2104 TaxID=1427455 RepID=A0A0A8L937_9SACH|nr:unnamed protein product [Kluyveromyces dobzhanskii CBS 2104]
MDQKKLGLLASRQLYSREWTSSVKSTAESFKTWDTCMDNKACKIIAIVGIVLASILALYLVGGILYCFKSGVTNISEFFCWCCSCRRRSNNPTNQNYQQQQPPMVVYQPIQNPDPGYGGYRDVRGNGYYDERLSTKSIDLEESFDLEAQRNPWRNNNKNAMVRDDEIELETYHPNMTKPSYVDYQKPTPSQSPSKDRYYHGGNQYVSTPNENPFYQNTGYYPDETSGQREYHRYS